MDEKEQMGKQPSQEEQAFEPAKVEQTPLPPSHNKLIIGVVAVIVLVVAGSVGAYFILQPKIQLTEEERVLQFAEEILVLYKNGEYGEIYDLSSEESKSTISKDVFISKNVGITISNWELIDMDVQEDKAYIKYHIWVYKEFEGDLGFDYDIEGPEPEWFNFISIESKWYLILESHDSPRDAEFAIPDNQQIFNIRNLQLGLDLYFDDFQEYPDDLNQLVPLYVATDITDPSTNRPYLYGTYTGEPFNLENKCTEGLKKCIRYHLGATLEDVSSDVLASDSDIESDIISGSDSSGCSYTNSYGACFDVSLFFGI